MEKIKIINAIQTEKDTAEEKANIEKFAAYCERLSTEKDKEKNLKNPWMQYKKEEELATLYKRVKAEGLVFDGVHITLQKRGVSYDYVAYKNKMLLVYPETIIDIGLVYKGDSFSSYKKNGKVLYEHIQNSPFEHKDSDLVGAYCIIKNQRGEFIDTIWVEDIEKCRKVAETQKIWVEWFAAMVRKTIIKLSCKTHMSDIYTGIEEMDNEQYNMEAPQDLALSFYEEIEAIDNLEDLKQYYLANKGKGKSFDKKVMERKEQLSVTTEENENS